MIYIPINYALINNTKLKAADIPSLDKYLIYDYKVYNSVNAYTYTVSNETASNCVYKTMIINNKEYQFIEGMTWYIWMNTKYNVDKLGTNPDGYECFTPLIKNNQNNSFVSSNALIEEGSYTYSFDTVCYVDR